MRQSSIAQCVNSFPYNEDFETNDGNWNGNPLHWEWGTPVGKTVMASAGAGLKCWIAGGLTGSSYASGSSELISPCFDFSSLVNPMISFKVFWETELVYDGATLQYSLDGGLSWTTLGSENSNNPCAGTENWFNYAPINFIGGNSGWSGNVQSGSGSCRYGQGSGQWLTAKHNLSNLAGQPNILFKFVFGAGTICNGFDGFAIDDIHIAETPANTADYGYTCGGNNTVQFANNPNPCEVAWIWNFGDPASGTENVSTEENPNHNFSSAGSYNVSLTINYVSGNTVIVPPKTIHVIQVTTTNSNLLCSDAHNGSISVNVNPAGAYSYSWNTNPVQITPTIANLNSNTAYIVTVTGTNTCNTIVSVVLSSPPPLTVSPVLNPAKCGHDNGSIAANVSGGVTPYIYMWSNGQSTSSISDLSAGSYTLSVKDANGCFAPDAGNIEVQAVVNPIDIFLGNDTTICSGQTLLLNAGSFAFYHWQDNSTLPTYAVTKTGDYSVQVTDNDGCTASSFIHVTVDCKGIYFPSAFTPNADIMNPSFGAIGDLGSLINYRLVIYNRYAQAIFTSDDPYKKWDGNYKGKALDTQSLVYTAQYTLQGHKPVSQKGSILLLR